MIFIFPKLTSVHFHFVLISTTFTSLAIGKSKKDCNFKSTQFSGNNKMKGNLYKGDG